MLTNLSLLLVVGLASLLLYAATTSSALTLTAALWLVNGADLANGTPLAITATGGSIFKNVLNGTEFLCEGRFDGTIVNNSGTPEQGLGEITKVLTVGKVEVPQLDEAAATGGITCTNIKTCSNGVEIWPGSLPWSGLIYQDPEDSTIWGEELTKGLYFIKCLIPLIGTVEELCEKPIGALGEALNVAGGIEGMGAASLLASCNGNANEGELVADTGGLLSLADNNPETLAISLNAGGT